MAEQVAAPALAVVERQQLVAQGLFGGVLDLGVEGGAHQEAAVVELGLAVGGDQVAAHLFGEMQAEGGVAPLLGDGDLFLLGGRRAPRG